MIEANETEQYYRRLEEEDYNRCRNLIPTAINELINTHIEYNRNGNFDYAFNYTSDYQNNNSWVSNIFQIDVVPHSQINTRMHNFERIPSRLRDFTINVQLLWNNFSNKPNERIKIDFATTQLFKKYFGSNYIDSEHYFQESFDNFNTIEGNDNDSYRIKIIKTQNLTDVFFVLFLDVCIDGEFYFNNYQTVEYVDFNTYIITSNLLLLLM